MRRLIIAQGEPMAGDHGVEDAPVVKESFKAAALLGTEVRRLGFRTSVIAAARSLSARQTADALGAQEVITYPLLDEVEGLDLSPEELRAKLRVGDTPGQVFNTAIRIRDNPPEPAVWVVHGTVAAGLKELSLFQRTIDSQGKDLLIPALGMFAMDA